MPKRKERAAYVNIDGGEGEEEEEEEEEDGEGVQQRGARRSSKAKSSKRIKLYSSTVVDEVLSKVEAELKETNAESKAAYDERKRLEKDGMAKSLVVAEQKKQTAAEAKANLLQVMQKSLEQIKDAATEREAAEAAKEEAEAAAASGKRKARRTKSTNEDAKRVKADQDATDLYNKVREAANKNAETSKNAGRRVRIAVQNADAAAMSAGDLSKLFRKRINLSSGYLRSSSELPSRRVAVATEGRSDEKSIREEERRLEERRAQNPKVEELRMQLKVSQNTWKTSNEQERQLLQVEQKRLKIAISAETDEPLFGRRTVNARTLAKRSALNRGLAMAQYAPARPSKYSGNALTVFSTKGVSMYTSLNVRFEGGSRSAQYDIPQCTPFSIQERAVAVTALEVDKVQSMTVETLMLHLLLSQSRVTEAALELFTSDPNNSLIRLVAAGMADGMHKYSSDFQAADYDVFNSSRDREAAGGASSSSAVGEAADAEEDSSTTTLWHMNRILRAKWGVYGADVERDSEERNVVVALLCATDHLGMQLKKAKPGDPLHDTRLVLSAVVNQAQTGKMGVYPSAFDKKTMNMAIYEVKDLLVSRAFDLIDLSLTRKEGFKIITKQDSDYVYQEARLREFNPVPVNSDAQAMLAILSRMVRLPADVSGQHNRMRAFVKSGPVVKFASFLCIAVVEHLRKRNIDVTGYMPPGQINADDTADAMALFYVLMQSIGYELHAGFKGTGALTVYSMLCEAAYRLGVEWRSGATLSDVAQRFHRALHGADSNIEVDRRDKLFMEVARYMRDVVDTILKDHSARNSSVASQSQRPPPASEEVDLVKQLDSTVSEVGDMESGIFAKLYDALDPPFISHILDLISRYMGIQWGGRETSDALKLETSVRNAYERIISDVSRPAKQIAREDLAYRAKTVLDSVIKDEVSFDKRHTLLVMMASAVDTILRQRYNHENVDRRLTDLGPKYDPYYPANHYAKVVDVLKKLQEASDSLQSYEGNMNDARAILDTQADDLLWNISTRAMGVLRDDLNATHDREGATVLTTFMASRLEEFLDSNGKTNYLNTEVHMAEAALSYVHLMQGQKSSSRRRSVLVQTHALLRDFYVLTSFLDMVRLASDGGETAFNSTYAPAAAVVAVAVAVVQVNEDTKTERERSRGRDELRQIVMQENSAVVRSTLDDLKIKAAAYRESYGRRDVATLRAFDERVRAWVSNLNTRVAALLEAETASADRYKELKDVQERLAGALDDPTAAAAAGESPSSFPVVSLLNNADFLVREVAPLLDEPLWSDLADIVAFVNPTDQALRFATSEVIGNSVSTLEYYLRIMLTDGNEESQGWNIDFFPSSDSQSMQTERALFLKMVSNVVLISNLNDLHGLYGHYLKLPQIDLLNKQNAKSARAKRSTMALSKSERKEFFGHAERLISTAEGGQTAHDAIDVSSRLNAPLSMSMTDENMVLIRVTLMKLLDRKLREPLPTYDASEPPPGPEGRTTIEAITAAIKSAHKRILMKPIDEAKQAVMERTGLADTSVLDEYFKKAWEGGAQVQRVATSGESFDIGNDDAGFDIDSVQLPEGATGDQLFNLQTALLEYQRMSAAFHEHANLEPSLTTFPYDLARICSTHVLYMTTEQANEILNQLKVEEAYKLPRSRLFYDHAMHLIRMQEDAASNSVDEQSVGSVLGFDVNKFMNGLKRTLVAAADALLEDLRTAIVKETEERQKTYRELSNFVMEVDED